MQVTRTSPVQFNIIPKSNSTLIVKFIVKGLRDIIRIDFNVVIYYKNPIHRNMVETVSSDILSVYTSTEDRYYKAQIKIPIFKNYIQCYLIFTISPNHGLDKKVFIEDVDIEHSPEKLDVHTIEEIPIERPKHQTINQTIDLTIDQYRRELPKDPIKRISYIYPLHGNDSFHIVASNHIKYLRYEYDKYIGTKDKYIEIEEIDWSQLERIDWKEKKNVLVHPFLYPFVSPESFTRNLRNFAKLLGTKNKIGGFDVADSNRISNLAVHLINKIDLMMVPSSFAKDAYIKSGVTIPVEVLPHGISDEFTRDDFISVADDKKDNNKKDGYKRDDNKSNTEISILRRMKDDGNILILYFLLHSEHRKAADLVKNVMKRIQNRFGNVYLVAKGKNISYFTGIRTICIDSWLDNDNLRLLYDTCDICISPSRGGGFELNALEAVSRGLPTLVTNGCCFLDLIDYFIPIKLSSRAVQPLPGNSVHTGYGCDVDIDDFEEKLIDVITRLNYWKGIFRNRSMEIRENYSWRNTAKILDRYLRNYGFIE